MSGRPRYHPQCAVRRNSAQKCERCRRLLRAHALPEVSRGLLLRSVAARCLLHGALPHARRLLRPGPGDLRAVACAELRPAGEREPTLVSAGLGRRRRLPERRRLPVHGSQCLSWCRHLRRALILAATLRKMPDGRARQAPMAGTCWGSSCRGFHGGGPRPCGRGDLRKRGGLRRNCGRFPEFRGLAAAR